MRFFQSQSFFKTLVGSLALSAGLCVNSHAAVWTTENQWSKEWEDRYAEWVKTNWDEHFFDKPGTPYTGLVMDCADAVYSMRIIFSYQNKLPFAMKDPSGGKNLVSNEMSRFDRLPADKRIRPFLQLIYDIASTQSLPDDTFSPIISRETVRSGSLIRTDKESHHSWTIKDIIPTGIPHLIFSSRPAKTTLLVRVGQPSMEFTFKGKLDPTRHAGFRNFRKLEDLRKPEWEVAGYSDEQYRFPYGQWQSIVKKKLALVDESNEAVLKRQLELACTNATERIQNINEGIEYLAKVGSRCLDAKEYDDFSTPNRDLRLKNSFEELRDTFHDIEGNKADFAKLPKELVQQIQDVLTDAPASRDQNRYCMIQISKDRSLSLGEVRRRSLGGRLSDNPNDPFEYRWGDVAGHSARAKKCPVY